MYVCVYVCVCVCVGVRACVRARMCMRLHMRVRTSHADASAVDISLSNCASADICSQNEKHKKKKISELLLFPAPSSSAQPNHPTPRGARAAANPFVSGLFVTSRALF